MYKSNIKKHEANCFKNPVTRSCSTCANRASRTIVDPAFGAPFTTEIPYCLERILFSNPSDGDTGKIKMYTNCSKWVERPEDEEELAIYQADKKVIEIFPTDDEILWP